MVAYLGPTASVAAVVEGGSYSLVRQASDYPDGFGIGWYPIDRMPEPVRMVARESITSAGPHLEVPRRYPSHCVLAAVQRAPRPPAELASAQPYAIGPLLFSQTGELDRFEEVFRRPLAERLSDSAFRSLRGLTAGELLFANFVDMLGDDRGHDAIAGALENLVGVVSEIGISQEAAATLAVVVADGEGLITLRTATQGPPPPLYTIVADANAPVPATGRVVASEPLFPGSWSALDPHSLVIFTADASPMPTHDQAPTATA